MISQKVNVGTPKDLDKIIPGDLMYHTNTDGTGAHIAMVLDIDKSGDTITMDNIKLIESTWVKIEGVRLWAKIHNGFSLSKYNKNNWIIVRPEVK